MTTITKKRKNFKHLTKNERYTIYEMYPDSPDKKSMQEIADYLGRSKSTISTEIKRNKKSAQ